MTAVRAFYQSLNLNLRLLSKEEKNFLEADLFTRVYNELKEIIRKQNWNYFQLTKLNKEKVNSMLEANFLRCIINDILSTEEYNLQGIAYYTGIPEDILYDVVAGFNSHPTLSLARKVIELHRLVRPDLYREIINKLTTQLFQKN